MSYKYMLLDSRGAPVAQGFPWGPGAAIETIAPTAYPVSTWI